MILKTLKIIFGKQKCNLTVSLKLIKTHVAKQVQFAVIKTAKDIFSGLNHCKLHLLKMRTVEDKMINID